MTAETRLRYNTVEMHLPSQEIVWTVVDLQDNNKSVYSRAAWPNDVRAVLINMCKAKGVEEYLNQQST